MHDLRGAIVPRGAFPLEEDKPWLHQQMSVTRPPRQIRNRFRSFAQEVADMEALQRTPLWDSFYGPAGTTDQTRMVMYSPEGAFLGWLGAMSQRPLTAKAHRALSDHRRTARILRLMLEAHDLEGVEAERAPLPDTFLCDPSGQLMAAKDPVSGWAAAHARELREVLESAEGDRVAFFVGGVCVAARRLLGVGDRSPVWACRAELKAPMTLDPLADLPLRQRQVAEFAANSATLEEIAEALGIAHGTVKTHLAKVYRRLGVADRVELADVLRGERRF